MKKRILSLLMALAMVLSLMPMAWAEDPGSDSSIFTTGGIRYRILDGTEKTVEVIHSSADQSVSNLPDSTYSGTITIPSKVTDSSSNTEYSVIGIDALAFISAKIESIILPEGLQYIDGGAFASSTLTSITIPASVTRLGGGNNSTPVFFGRGNGSCAITSVTFAQGSQLKTIADGVFSGCDNLASLEIPAGVEDLGLDEIASANSNGKNLGVFDGWKNAKDVTFAEGSPYQKDNNGVLYKGETLCVALDDQITSVTVKDGTKAIADGAFFMCTKLATVNLPDGLETIGDGAFNYAPLVNVSIPNIPGVPTSGMIGTTPANVVTQINIPATVTSIGRDFLKGGLKDDGSSIVIMQGTIPPTIGEGAFATKGSDPAKLKIIYPKDAAEVYKESSYALASYITAAESDSSNETFSYTLNVPESLSLVENNSTEIGTAVVPTGWQLTVDPATNDVVTISTPDETTGKITATAQKTGEVAVKFSIKKESSDIVLAEQSCTITVTAASNPGNSSGGGSSTPTYTVTTPKSDNGTVTVSPKNASKGTTVTITVKPDAGYELDSLTVTDKNGDALKLTDKGDGKYTFVMSASKVEIKATFAEIDTSCDGGASCPAHPYGDVNTNSWYHEAVDYVVENSIMNGTGNDTFEPTANLSRAMLMTMLARLDGADTTGGATWYEKGMAWAVANGVSDGTNPSGNITREQIAAMLYRYAQLKGYDTTKMASIDTFADGASTSAWAEDAMQWAVGIGVLQGKDGNRLDPQGSASRAEVVQMLMNFCVSAEK